MKILSCACSRVVILKKEERQQDLELAGVAASRRTQQLVSVPSCRADGASGGAVQTLSTSWNIL